MSNRRAAELVRRIDQARTAAGQTWEAISEKTGIPYSTLNRKRTVKPEDFTVQDLTKIAEAIGVDFDSLLIESVAS